MRTSEAIINEYVNCGKITKEQGLEIMEKCASMEIKALSKFFKNFAQKLKPIFKKAPEQVASTVEKIEPIKPLSRLDKIKATLSLPDIKKALIASGVTTGIAGTMGAGSAIGHAASTKKQIKRNYENLINTNPGLFKETDKPQVQKLVAELTVLAPSAATNDDILKKYVLKGLSKKLDLKDMATASSIRSRKKNYIMDAINRPPMPAQLIGQITAAYHQVPEVDKIMGAMSPTEKEDALVSDMLTRAYKLTPEFKKRFQQEMRKDSRPIERLHTYSRGTLAPEKIEAFRNDFLNEDLSKKASAKISFLEGIKRTLPYMAGLAAVGTGVGAVHVGAEAVRTMKERNMIQNTFDSIKKNPDFKGREKELKMAFNTLAKFAPALATQPQTALAFVRSAVIDYADPKTGEPMIDPSQIKGLADLQKTYEQRESRSPFVSSFGKGFQRGFEGTGTAARTLGNLAGKDLLASLE